MSAPLSTSSSVSSSSAIAGASSRSAEVEKVEFETRMRQLIVELLEPTIKRVSRHEAEGAAIRKQLAKHADALKESQTLAVQAQQQLATVDYFKEELAKWDTQRRNQEAKVAEDIAFMRQDLDSFRLDLERKDGSIESLQRMNDRMNTQVTRVIELQDQHRSAKYCTNRAHMGKQGSTETEHKLAKLSYAQKDHSTYTSTITGSYVTR
eukprot:GHVT01102130.1.p1 GENE.GHVT01102130.1~~GHVT01102130.1.p1  ORF type:complete len:208 (-),score=30.16 GHVT01102130.1:635-1258(-)